MSNGSMRCLDDYLPGTLPGQPILLAKLEKCGLENGDTRILTTRRVGVPVTVYLLILHETLKSLAAEQARLRAREALFGTLSSEELLKQIPIEPLQSKMDANLIWEHRRGLDSSITATASGCAVYKEANYYIPTVQVAPINTIFRSRDPLVLVCKGHIAANDTGAPLVPMMPIFKMVFMAIEMCYSLEERLKAERDGFNRILKVQVPLPELSATLVRQCSRRGDLIHSGNLGLEIAPTTMMITLGGEPLVEAIQAAFRDICKLAEQLYTEMLKVLPVDEEKSFSESTLVPGL